MNTIKKQQEFSKFQKRRNEMNRQCVRPSQPCLFIDCFSGSNYAYNHRFNRKTMEKEFVGIKMSLFKVSLFHAILAYRKRKYAQVYRQWYRYHPNKIPMQNVLHIDRTKKKIKTKYFILFSASINNTSIALQSAEKREWLISRLWSES